jgi:hypothetical protein
MFDPEWTWGQTSSRKLWSDVSSWINLGSNREYKTKVWCFILNEPGSNIEYKTTVWCLIPNEPGVKQRVQSYSLKFNPEWIWVQPESTTLLYDVSSWMNRESNREYKAIVWCFILNEPGVKQRVQSYCLMFHPEWTWGQTESKKLLSDVSFWMNLGSNRMYKTKV